jgi:hypothetical protein
MLSFAIAYPNFHRTAVAQLRRGNKYLAGAPGASTQFGVKIMSAEYKSLPAIPFNAIDSRLERRGIKIEFHGDATALIGARGTLFAKSDGHNAYFERKLGVDAKDVLEAIEAEYAVAILDENDRRFWGIAENDRWTVEKTSRSWIVIEGPSLEAGFIQKWLEGVEAFDEALKDYFRNNPVFNEDGEHIEIAELFAFSPCAMALLCLWINESAVFGVNLVYSVHAEALSVMAATGFLIELDQHYRISIPPKCDVASILNALLRLEETSGIGDHKHPERLLTTMTQEEMLACTLRLRGSDDQRDPSARPRKLRLIYIDGRKVRSE